MILFRLQRPKIALFKSMQILRKTHTLKFSKSFQWKLSFQNKVCYNKEILRKLFAPFGVPLHLTKFRFNMIFKYIDFFQKLNKIQDFRTNWATDSEINSGTNSGTNFCCLFFDQTIFRFLYFRTNFGSKSGTNNWTNAMTNARNNTRIIHDYCR